MHRRDFLRTSGALMAVPALGSLARGMSVIPEGPDRVLVLVELSGGNDGLNTVIPFEDDRYFELRPRLGIKTGHLSLDDGLGLNPAMGGLHGLWKQGDLAVVQGVGYPKPNRSHFRSMDIWQSARPDLEKPTHGWLGLAADALRARGNGLPAMACGSVELPLCLHAKKSVIPALGTLKDYELWQDGRAGGRKRARRDALAGVAADAPGDDAVARLLKRTAREAYDGSEQLKRAAESYRPKASYAPRGLGRSMELGARALTAPLGTRIVHVRQGGYDTHAGQARTHDTLLRSFSDAVAAFAKDMKAHGLWDKTVVFAFSEFGRRCKENKSRGTDHGVAGPCFVAGGAIKGGLYGEHPSLTDLDQGDLKTNVDFRSIYRDLLEGWLDLPAKGILHGEFPRLGVV